MFNWLENILPAGLARMPLRSFIFYTFIGAGLWNTLLAGVGYFLFTQQETLHKYVTELSLVTLIAGGIFFAYIFTRKKIKT